MFLCCFISYCTCIVLCNEVYSALLHSQLKEQYASLRVVVEESLNLNVHVDQLQDVKRNVRDLRRQYGHRLVDQKEFSQDPLNESIEELHRVGLFVAGLRKSKLLCCVCHRITMWHYSSV